MSLQFSDDALAAKFLQMVDDVAAIKTATDDLPELRKTVEQHDRLVTFAKWTGLPILATFHLGVKHLLSKVGL